MDDHPLILLVLACLLGSYNPGPSDRLASTQFFIRHHLALRYTLCPFAQRAHAAHFSPAPYTRLLMHLTPPSNSRSRTVAPCPSTDSSTCPSERLPCAARCTSSPPCCSSTSHSPRTQAVASPLLFDVGTIFRDVRQIVPGGFRKLRVTSCSPGVAG